MRSEGSVESTLATKAQYNQGGREGNMRRTRREIRQKNVTQVADGEEEEHFFVATCFAISHSSEERFIDSGCTNHTTFDRDQRVGYFGSFPSKDWQWRLHCDQGKMHSCN
ncbi:two-component response regulator-like APRR2 isoform X1 [Gossypium australe]|uniref:Two-component response regulator-like APRR2 isoform X1 n=1 Tax=Gossypium australe TaxID=47621 RepID=A0A5B6UV50_9ROSI|nr:two-component response regulator-like APRR2 isoform X1 [Gossypium australe]